MWGFEDCTNSATAFLSEAWTSEGEERSGIAILGFSKTLEIKGAGFLIEAREKIISWELSYYPYAIQLEIAKMYFFYGEYDWAEQQLRYLHSAPAPLQHARDVLIGRIICQQKEDWGLEILFPLLNQSSDPIILAEVCFLSARYYLRFSEKSEAFQALEEAKEFLQQIENTQLVRVLIIQGYWLLTKLLMLHSIFFLRHSEKQKQREMFFFLERH